MMTDRQEALVSLLLGSFPNFASGDGEAALGAYELVLRQSDERDHEPGVMILINGEYPGHDGRFAPTAPQLASAIRMARDKRLDRERDRRPQLAPPDIQHDPESQARVRQLMRETIAGLGGSMRSPDAAEELARQASKERIAKQDAMFRDEFISSGGGLGPISKSLAKKLGYIEPKPNFTAGDPDGDRDVA